MYKIHQGAKHIPLKLKSPAYTFTSAKAPPTNPSDSFKADASPVKAWTNQVDAISASASLTADGTINVSLVNASRTESYPVELTFEELNLTEAHGRVLSAERLDAHNSFNKPATVQPRTIETLKSVGNKIQITLPPASVSAFTAR
jgi:alpha-N-arabinofuranosidase